VNSLRDNLHDDLIIGDHLQYPSERAIGCDKYPKVAIELSDIFSR